MTMAPSLTSTLPDPSEYADFQPSSDLPSNRSFHFGSSLAFLSSARASAKQRNPVAIARVMSRGSIMASVPLPGVLVPIVSPRAGRVQRPDPIGAGAADASTGGAARSTVPDDGGRNPRWRE